MIFWFIGVFQKYHIFDEDGELLLKPERKKPTADRVVNILNIGSPLLSLVLVG